MQVHREARAEVPNSAGKGAPSAVVMDGLRRIVRALRQADAESRIKDGIGSAQLFVLRQLRNKPALSIGELCQATLTSQSSVSEVAATLELKHLVRRSKAGDDNRRVELSLTPAGEKLLESSPQPFQERLVFALRRLPPDDQQALAKGMTAWLREAGISGAPPTMFFQPDRGES